ncbi:unnamed protein product [Ixodes persulcatus]
MNSCLQNKQKTAITSIFIDIHSRLISKSKVLKDTWRTRGITSHHFRDLLELHQTQPAFRQHLQGDNLHQH